MSHTLLCMLLGEIMHKVPIFRGCPDGFMRSLVPLLVPEVVIPGDYIIREGEIGREMYLLRHGQLEVIAHGQGHTLPLPVTFAPCCYCLFMLTLI